MDEIQEAEKVITSLKYLHENAPQYHVVAAGSFRGVALHEKTSSPVGKVDFLKLYPLSFGEFLLALKQNALFDVLKKEEWQTVTLFRNKLSELLRLYYFTGGMPEVVHSYVTENDLNKVRVIQKNILNAYEQDFSKYAPSDIVPRIKMLWQSVSSQLARENRKFIYRAVKTGSRAKDFEHALTWLTDAGLVYKVHRIRKPSIPLISYSDAAAFKIFTADIGLLSAMCNLDERSLLTGNVLFNEFKGALTEQYVYQELVSREDSDIFYWSSETAKAEVDFVIQNNGKIIPVEVKAKENLQAKSIKSFHQKYNPESSVRTSMSDYRKESWLTNIPLYAIGQYSF